MEKLDIFICTHKDFEPFTNNEIYKVVDSRNISVQLPLTDKFYSELYQYKFVHDNYQLKDYVGFCHYRRYFKLSENFDIDKWFNELDVITVQPMVFNCNVRQHYGYFHNVEDYDLIGKIIKEKFSDYYQTYLNVSYSNIFFPNNMFIMKSEDFKEYIKFVFGVLDEYLKITGTDIVKRIEDNKDKYLKTFSPNDTVDYQYRIGGYAGERLTNIFILKHFDIDKIGSLEQIITEKKYDNE